MPSSTYTTGDHGVEARMQFWNVHRGNSSKGLEKPVTDTSHHLLEAGVEAGVEAGSALRSRVAALVYSPVGVEVGKTKPLPALESFLRDKILR